MLDITNYKKEISTYGGSEMKMTYYIDNKKYMVKFPDPIREKNKNISYINNQYSEYIGSKVFKLFNIDTQEVELVTCQVNDKTKVAVACLDFLEKDEILIEFKNISYSLNPEKKYDSSIEDIYEMIKLLPNLDNKQIVIEEFWKRFIVDALIGNVDRHLGNWGFIKKNDKYRLSPVYDCGSALNPLIDEKTMEELLHNPRELKNISYNIKTSYKMNNKPINYVDIFKSMPNDLKKQVKVIVPMINMDKIKEIIYNIDCLSDVQKEFYYKTVLIRKENILDIAYQSILKEEN